MTSDEVQHLDRQSAYLDAVRAIGRPARVAGLICCLLGVLILVVGRYKFGGMPWLLWGGAAVVAAGWALFIYAVARRLFWIRSHPFDSNG
jgi:hypothetical protein